MSFRFKMELMKLFLYRVKQHTTFFIVLFFPSVLISQNIYTSRYLTSSDIKVYVVKFESQSDLKVFKVKYQSQTQENEGLWYSLSILPRRINNRLC